MRPECHPDCGPLVQHNAEAHTHAHDGGDDGICWHDDES